MILVDWIIYLFSMPNFTRLLNERNPVIVEKGLQELIEDALMIFQLSLCGAISICEEKAME